MLIYYMYILFLLLIYLFRSKLKKYNKIINFISIGFLFVIFAFRATSVGADTKTYEILYNNQYEWNEKGYVYLVRLFNYFGFSFRFFLIIISFFSIFSLNHFLQKYSKDYIFSLILFVTIGLFSMYMTGIRQVIAISILLWSIDFIFRKKIFVFVLIVLLASSFHTSALVFLPIYFLNYINFTKNKILIFFFVFCIIIMLFKNYIWSFVSTIIPNQYDDLVFNSQDYYTNILVIIIEVSILFFVIFYYKNSKLNSNIYNTMIVFQIISILFQIFGYSALQISRLSYYFACAKIIIIPNTLENFYNKGDKIFFIIVILLFSILKFSISTPGSYSKIDEYEFYFFKEWFVNGCRLVIK